MLLFTVTYDFSMAAESKYTCTEFEFYITLLPIKDNAQVKENPDSVLQYIVSVDCQMTDATCLVDDSVLTRVLARPLADGFVPFG